MPSIVVLACLFTKYHKVQLKSLEIKGFKSFADKTVLHFNENMTGIVGPNGCGKSNTIDAVRWVLGEQKSKALRLEKMDNIIFNGTKSRKQSGRAEVALTFENTRNLLPTEFTTVTVKRVIYRTGDSEYLLNGVKCRLKDIRNLFMDTGISSDSYAIIELKMIDEILNDKDNSRRKLFEQAAGISKYKRRKRETLNKLKGTDADLERVEDLLFEIEKNLKSLERQAKRTERYYKLKEQYKELSVEFALHKIGQHKGSFTSLNKQQETEKDRKLGIETQLQTLEAKLANKKAGIIDEEKQLADLQKQLNDLVAVLQQKENNRNLLQQNIRFLEEQKSTLEQRIYQANQLVESLKKEVDHLVWDKKGEEGEMEKVVTRLDELKANADQVRQLHRERRAELESVQSEAKKTELQLFEVEKKIAVTTSQRDSLTSEIKDNQIKFQSQQAELAELRENMSKAEKDFKTSEKTLADLVKEKEDFQKQIDTLTQTIEDNRHKQSALNRELDAKRNEYKLTKSLVDSLEGFPDSIKYLKKNNQQWNEHAPLLLDIINCEDKYKVAIENYLKPHLNNYVVETVEEAIAAVNLLDKSNKGKANFFIMSDLKAKGKTKLLDIKVKDAIVATSIMKESDPYQELINYLLRNVYIVDNDFTPDEKLLETGAIFISNNGKTIRHKMTLSGGSVGAYEGKRIGKRQQLTQLQKEIKKLETAASKLSESVSTDRKTLQTKQTDIRKKSNWINHQQQQLNKLTNLVTSFRVKIESSESFIAQSENKELGLNERIELLENQTKEYAQNLEKLQEVQEKNAAVILAAEQTFLEVSQKLSEASHAYNEQNINYHKQQNRINTLAQSLSFKQKQLNDNLSQLGNDGKSLKEANEKQTDLEKQLATELEQLKGFYKKREERQAAVNDAETLYYQVRGDVDKVEKEMRIQQKNKEQVDLLLQNINEKLSNIKIQLLSLKERLNIEFGINIDDIIDKEPSEEFTKQELDEKVTKLKKRLDNYGEINPMAVEAYNEMKERYDFIMVQREDLLEAKGSLLKTIREIEGTATEKFMTAFNDVRANFVEVFRSLFTDEDQCDIRLVDESDPLESAIDIMAKPKGKRPQSINQLSGGEKSLTALALVFSLYLLKPAPFCILDEVDAPLDDSNVSKFTKIIRKFSEQSQFIIVTHNKNTMASVDVIYGVTMQEAGVSSVVPVDFRTLISGEDWDKSLTEIKTAS